MYTSGNYLRCFWVSEEMKEVVFTKNDIFSAYKAVNEQWYVIINELENIILVLFTCCYLIGQWILLGSKGNIH